jgi:hypothetical protein
MKVVRLSALRTGHRHPKGNIPGTHFSLMLSQPQGQSATGRIMSMKNSNDTIGNLTRDLPVCSAVPQPTAPPRVPPSTVYNQHFNRVIIPTLSLNDTRKRCYFINWDRHK